jgi:hypothetical protein
MTKIAGKSGRVAGRIVRDDSLLRVSCRLGSSVALVRLRRTHPLPTIRAQASKLSGGFGKYLRVGSANIIRFQILGRNGFTDLDLLPSQLRDSVAADRFRLDDVTVR